MMVPADGPGLYLNRMFYQGSKNPQEIRSLSNLPDERSLPNRLSYLDLHIDIPKSAKVPDGILQLNRRTYQALEIPAEIPKFKYINYYRNLNRRVPTHDMNQQEICKLSKVPAGRFLQNRLSHLDLHIDIPKPAKLPDGIPQLNIMTYQDLEIPVEIPRFPKLIQGLKYYRNLGRRLTPLELKQLEYNVVYEHKKRRNRWNKYKNKMSLKLQVAHKYEKFLSEYIKAILKQDIENYQKTAAEWTEKIEEEHSEDRKGLEKLKETYLEVKREYDIRKSKEFERKRTIKKVCLGLASPLIIPGLYFLLYVFDDDLIKQMIEINPELTKQQAFYLLRDVVKVIKENSNRIKETVYHNPTKIRTYNGFGYIDMPINGYNRFEVCRSTIPNDEYKSMVFVNNKYLELKKENTTRLTFEEYLEDLKKWADQITPINID